MLAQKLNYNYIYANELCDKHGLKFDARIAGVADPVFSEANMSQEQVDDMIFLWVKLICWLFDRKSHGWLARICLSLYFLGVGKRIKADVE